MNPQLQLQHTPGPWRWEFNAEHRSLHLVGGKPRHDLTIMDFARWGMSGATMRLRDPAHDGMQLLYRVHERPDWIAPEKGREHHKSWHQLLTHPDALMIEAAPRLLAVLEHIRRCVRLDPTSGQSFVQIHAGSATMADIDAAIAQARGWEGGAA